MKKEHLHKNLCELVHETYKVKNKAYGDAFTKSYNEYGLIMPCIRLEDKLNRFKNLINSSVKAICQESCDESMEDTLLDLANYAIMTVLELRTEVSKNG